MDCRKCANFALSVEEDNGKWIKYLDCPPRVGEEYAEGVTCEWFVPKK